MEAPIDSQSKSERWKGTAAAAVIAVAALAAYANTFGVPFVFDDPPSILDNPGIRHLWPVWDAFRPQAPASTVDGRPFANFTLAVNYALSGTGVWSYHALNLLIHVCAGLALFGVVRRTLVLWECKGQGVRSKAVSDAPGEATWLAFAIALLWTLHPLQTEAVTYVVQRVESLMALFYLLTLYCFIRGAEGTTGPPTTDHETSQEGSLMVSGRWSGGLLWYSLSVFCCLLGMATKEVMVTAPVMVLLYDRTFLAGTFRKAWRRRRWLYLGFASTWLLLGGLVAGTGWDRGGAAGFDVGVKPWHYWLTQPEAILRYLWLAVWPHPLVFDYGTFFHRSLASVWWQALALGLMLLASMVALLRKPAAGFLVAWFFGILAVTSVVPGSVQMIVEHRMYLPLAAVVTGVVLGVHACLGRPQDHKTADHTTAKVGGLVVSGLVVSSLAVALGLLTFRRNTDYRSELALWADTVAQRPNSPRARNALAFALDAAGRPDEAIAEFAAAMRLSSDNAELHDNLGVTLAGAGRTADAIAEFEAALRLRPAFATAHNNLGNALVQAGKPAEAIAQYEEALRLKPDYADAAYNLAGALDRSGRPADALGHLQAVVRLKPDMVSAHYNLGDLLDRLGRPADAIAHYEQALRLDPDMARAHAGLGVLLCRNGQMEAGLAQLREAVRLRPDDVPARFNLGVALMRAGRTPEAAAEFEAVLRLRPDYAPARQSLERIRAVPPAGQFRP